MKCTPETIAKFISNAKVSSKTKLNVAILIFYFDNFSNTKVT